jgi:oxygen-independent coproporphyrinogen-3 oxidase
MHGLPEQTEAGALDDLHAALGHKPTHLSWYQLTIEPNTVFYKRPPMLPIEDVLADIQSTGEALLKDAGYRQYEVSAWSLPGFECRHNLNYWLFGDYLGIGAGAHGKITSADGVITRYAKRRQPADYMAAGTGNFTAETRVLAREDVLGEFMLNALRLNRGFSLDLFTSRTGLAPDALEPQLEHLRNQGLLDLDGCGLRATPRGRRFLDNVVGEFFREGSSR